MTTPVAMVAGEASGDLLASRVLDPLAARVTDLTAYGVGGPQMIAHGFRADWPISKLSVMGYVEVLKHLVEIVGIRRELKRRLLADPPAAFVGVDAPDFNLGLEEALRTAWRGQGRPVVHFIGPSIWAWRAERIHQIKRAVDHMLVLFPFEPAIYHAAGIPATYVGHPLADLIPRTPDRAAARAALGLASDGRDGGRLIALMPGSRIPEVSALGATFLDAAAILHRRHPDVRFVVPAANATIRELLDQLVRARPDLPVTLVDGRSHAVLEAADAVLLASGTATLEAALYKRPMVIAYRVAPLTAFLMKRRATTPWVGLPNVLAGRRVVPELLQDAATPAAIADALEFQLVDDANRRELEERFTTMHDTLRCDTGARAADVIAGLIAASRTSH